MREVEDEVKRFVGRQMREVEDEVKRFPYAVTDAGYKVQLDCPALGRRLAPEEVSAHVLRKLRRDAESHLQADVSHAVITVPAYFNDAQRHATRDAGRIAGLNVLRISSEPTMAALAYGLDAKNATLVLVLDLGGGTFDVSLLEVSDSVLEVLGTAGDTHLGGNDFDDRIVDWLVGTFEQREGIDLRQDAQALQRLIEAAERAKMELSSLSATRISVPFVSMGADGPKHIEETLTRDHFEDLCRDLVDRIRTPVQTLLAEQGFRAKDLAEVVFVGGSSRMPMFHDVARELTGFKPVNKSVNVEEVVAVGAAVQASMLIGETRDIMLFDVTPLTLGVETNGGVFTPLINRNQTLPHKKVMMFTTSENAQDEIEVIVLQGERPMAKDNKRLGSFVLDNIPPAPIGVPKIEVSFEIGLDGILEVTAKDWATRRTQSIRVENASTLKEEEVDRVLKESTKMWLTDWERMENAENEYAAERLASQTTELILNRPDRVPLDVQQTLWEVVGRLEKAVAVKEEIDYPALKKLVKESRYELMKAGERIYGNQVAPDGMPGPGKRRESGGVTGSDASDLPKWVPTQQDWKRRSEEVEESVRKKKVEAEEKARAKRAEREARKARREAAEAAAASKAEPAEPSVPA